ncbi:gliding motility-associated C-terminal domain-containing protein [Ulvibacterium sp.]|uniref:T9SS type B sorting domain-containing protein n=1 Tax=Ulvibacterium sp. TaxID=2665914 RepID=UPI003BAA3C2E
MTDHNSFHSKTFFLVCLAFISFLNLIAQTQPNGTVDDNSSGSTVSSNLNTNLRLWLDANDKTTLYRTSTVTGGESIAELESANSGTDYTGTEIRLWLDKSSFNSHVSNTDPTKFPIYVANGGSVNNNLPTLEFLRAQQDHLRIALPETNAGNGERWEGEYTVFIVFEQLTDGGIDHSFFSNGDTFADDNHFQISVSAATGDDFVFKSNNAANVKFLDFEPEKQNELKLYSLRSDANGTEALVDGTRSDFDATLDNNGNKFWAYNINRNRNNNSFNDSRISEVIIYDRILTDCELSEVNKYLGDKYGKDFSSSFAALYDDNLNPAYDNLTAGIGLNEAICGGVTDKRNTATSNGLTLSVDDADNIVNRNYIAFSDNGGTETRNNNVPTGTFFQRMDKSWLFQEYGNNVLGNQALDFEFDIPVLWDGLQASSFGILVDDDGDFSNAEFIGEGSLSLGKILFENVVLGTDTTLDLQTDTPVYIALAIHPSPGGISSGLELWHKADAGFTYNSATDAEWLGQSTNGTVLNANLVQGPDTDSAPQLNSNVLNFNPGVDFDGVDNGLATAINAANFNFSETTVFSLQQVIAESTVGNNTIWHYGTDGHNDLALFIDPDSHGFNIVFNRSSEIKVNDPILADHLPHLTGFIGNSSTTKIHMNSKELASSSGMSALPGSGAFLVGLDADVSEAYDGDNHLEGLVGEILIYGRELTSVELQKVWSYLALKYGITLDQTAPIDYMASNGSTFWDASENTGYDNHIFGIVRDDGSGLDQKVSQSVNSTTGPILATNQDFLTSNQDSGRTSLDDRSSLILAHNNGTDNSFTSSFDGGTNNRLDRVWKVEETGTVGDIYFAIPEAAVSNRPTNGYLSLTLSSDEVFDGTDNMIRMNFDGTLNLFSAQINPNDGDYLALVIDETSYTLSETALTIDENGGTGTFTVVLGTEPTSDVVLDVTSDDTAEATVDKAQLTFTATDWDTPQTVTVTGVDDNVVRDDSATITIAINDAGSDDIFDALANQEVAITLTNEDVNLPVFTAPQAAYNVSSANYTNNFLNVPPNLNYTYGITFNQDGSKLFVSTFDREIVSYDLSVPFDVSTATYNTDLNLSHRSQGITFSIDGTKLYHTGNSSAGISEYHLSTPYDLSTATFNSRITPSEGLNYDGIELNSDGTKMFLLEYNGSDILEYALGSPFDITSAIYTDIHTIAGETDPNDFTFNGDGSQLFVLGFSEGISVHNLSTPFDVSTAVFSGESASFDTDAQENNPYGIAFSTGGNKVFLVGSDNRVYEYEMKVELEYSENDTATVVDVQANDGDGDASDSGITYVLTSGGDNDLFSIDADTGALTFLASPDFENPSDNGADNTYDIEVIATDVDGSAALEISIVVNDVNETPEITSTATASFAENASGTILDVEASDEEGETEGSGLSYIFSTDSGGGVDNGSFDIDPNTGVITFAASPDFENPGDNDTNNDYEVQVTVSDSGGEQDIQDIMISVTDVDDTPPSGYSVAIDMDPINDTNHTAVSFTFVAAEIGATYNYSFSSSNGGVNVTGNGTIVTATDQITGIDLSGLGDGTITLSVTLTDTEGNEGTPATDTSTKDSVAPSGYTVEIDQDPINSSNQDAASFTFSGAEVGTTYNYSFSSSGGGANVSGGGTIVTTTDQIMGIDLSGLSDGTITLSVTLTDVAGNGGTPATDTSTKDATAPIGYAVTIDQAVINNSNQNSISFTFSGAEIGTTYNYTFFSNNGGTDATGSGVIVSAMDQIETISLITLNDGNVTLNVTLTDPAGNEGTTASDNITKDAVAPNSYTVSIDQNPIDTSNQNIISFTFAGAEVGTTYNYRFSSDGGGTDVTDSGTITTATDQVSGIDLSGLGDGTITLSVALTDTSGNEGTAATDSATKNTDDDNDGVKDDVDNCPTIANADQTDTNNDSEGDACDDDDDGDGTLDINDDFPLDDTEDTDTDGDGIGNNADTDDDNDGLLDVEDPNPLVDTQTTQPQLNGPIGNTTSYDQLSIEYVIPEAPLAGSVTLTFTSNDNPNSPIVLQLDDGAIVPGLTDSFIWDPQVDAASLPQIVSATYPTLSDGTYDITLSYQDALGNPAATVTNSDHTIITDLLVTSLSISSNNSSPEWAKEGDRVIFDFSFNRPVDNVFLQYFGTALAFTGTPNNGSAYQGWIEVGPGTPEGTVSFTLTANSGTHNLVANTTMNGSSVTVDTTPPVPSLVIARSLHFDPFDMELRFSEPVENVAPSPIGVVPDNTQPTAELGAMETITPGLVYRIPVTPLIPGEMVFFNDLTDIARDRAGNPSVPLGFVNGTFYDLDSDGDGIGNTADSDDDGDGTPDTDDAFPLDANEDTDTDGDGTGDNADTDDDGDGTPDIDDAFPTDPNEDTDTDGDGEGDNADTDDDNDGIPDSEDENPNEPLDSDGDGTPDFEDNDDDNDGVPDVEDDFPNDPNEHTDTDGDGEGDNSDMDDDNDGIPDNEDADVDGDGIIDNGTDSDGDGINDENDDLDDNIDTDGDGIPDVNDDFPNDPDESVDQDGDGIGANADIDDNDANVGQEQAVTSAQAFTPNGDNINDTWIVQGIENYPNAMVTVYNRYGHEVFKALGYKNNWDGRYGSRSENLPAGSYYYVIDLRNGSAPMDGWLFINY